MHNRVKLYSIIASGEEAGFEHIRACEKESGPTPAYLVMCSEQECSITEVPALRVALYVSPIRSVEFVMEMGWFCFRSFRDWMHMTLGRPSMNPGVVEDVAARLRAGLRFPEARDMVNKDAATYDTLAGLVLWSVIHPAGRLLPAETPTAVLLRHADLHKVMFETPAIASALHNSLESLILMYKDVCPTCIEKLLEQYHDVLPATLAAILLIERNAGEPIVDCYKDVLQEAFRSLGTHENPAAMFVALSIKHATPGSAFQRLLLLHHNELPPATQVAGCMSCNDHYCARDAQSSRFNLMELYAGAGKPWSLFEAMALHRYGAWDKNEYTRCVVEGSVRIDLEDLNRCLPKYPQAVVLCNPMLLHMYTDPPKPSSLPLRLLLTLPPKPDENYLVLHTLNHTGGIMFRDRCLFYRAKKRRWNKADKRWGLVYLHMHRVYRALLVEALKANLPRDAVWSSIIADFIIDKL